MTEKELFNEWLKHYEKYDVRIDQLQRAFMWQAWQASANREGFKLVPIEPTEAMVVALETGFEFAYEESNFNAREAYAAMVGAVDD